MYMTSMLLDPFFFYCFTPYFMSSTDVAVAVIGHCDLN